MTSGNIKDSGKQNMSNETINKALDFLYKKSINGLGVFKSADDMANNFLTKNNNDKTKATDSLIKYQIAKSATSGFLTNIGGLITLPIAIPANFSSVLYIQLRLVTTVAAIGGYDLKSDQVKTCVYMCLAGNGIKDIAKEVGIHVGVKFGTNFLLKNISGKMLTKINQAVGFRLLTKFGTKGVINLCKGIPLAGGIIGASFDGGSTALIGKTSKELFILSQNSELTQAMQNDESMQTTQKSESIQNSVSENDSTKMLNLNKIRCLANLVKIDNKIEKEEKDFIIDLVTKISIDEKDKSNIIENLDDVTYKYDIDFSFFENDSVEAITLISLLILLAKKDNDFHISEKIYIKGIAQKLNISDSDLKELFGENE